MSAQLAPAYPAAGYLPTRLAQLLAVRSRQQGAVAQARCEAREQGLPAPCVQQLHLSLFFDGTNNHGDSDDAANPACSSNIRRLYNASIGKPGQGNNEGYYSYYIQGVGTAFPEIGEHGPSSSGLSMAVGGEDRILWGLTRLVDCLQKATGGSKLEDDQARQMIKAMQYQYRSSGRDGAIQQQHSTTRAERREVIFNALREVQRKVARGDKPHTLSLRVYVYGFSRGAAEARAFLWRLHEQLDDDNRTLCGIPLQLVFAGLFDTVASVGSTELLPNGEGHMGWADGTMRLPDGLVQQCEHMVSAHEQRLCFALDAVALPGGGYPAGAREWVYPGMHSDVGGGYPPGDQGKAREGQSMLLSQLPLLHMYRLAFDAGAPLQVNERLLVDANAEQLAMLKAQESWRFMDEATQKLFTVHQTVCERFEAWRSAAQSGSLDSMLRAQTEQITAWRLLRYAGGLAAAGGGLAQAEFYRHSQDDPPWLSKAKEAAWENASKQHKQNGGKALPVKLPAPDGGPAVVYQPNTNKNWEPVLDQTQLREAAQDFSDDYTGKTRLSFNLAGGLVTFFSALSRPFSDDCGSEYELLRQQAVPLYEEVAANSALVALYDEHVHDSRAWFMHASLGKREPHGTYWRYRTVYYTDGHTNKPAICKAPNTPKQAPPNAEQAQNERRGDLLTPR